MISKYIKKNNFLYKYFSNYKLITRYIVAGGIGALINIFSLYILTSIIGIWYITSAILSFTVSLIMTFFLQKFWAFRDTLFTKKHVLRQAILYTISSTSFLALNILILYVLVDMFNMWYLLAQFFSLGIVAFGSFLFNKKVTFKKVDVVAYDVKI